MSKKWQSWQLFILLGFSPLLFLYSQSTDSSLESFNPRIEVFQLPGGTWGNYVREIVQDSVGFMWFASRNGLYRYDGYKLKSYWHSPYDSSSLSLNWTGPLYIGRDGTLWAGTRGGGLNAFDYQTETFTHFKHDPADEETLSNDLISDIVEDTTGCIWVATLNGLNRLDRNTGKVKRFLPDASDPGSISDDNIIGLYVDSQGTLWIGTGFGSQNKSGLNRYNPYTESFTQYFHQSGNDQSLSNSGILSMLEDSYGNFWIGTWGDGLNSMDREKGMFTRYPYDPHDPEQPSKPYIKENNFHDAITSLFEDRDKRLWIGSFRGGLSCYDPVSKSVKHFTMEPDDPGSLKSWPGKIMCQSQDGTIWLSVNASLSPQTQKIVMANNYFSYYPVGDWVNEIITDRQDRLWLATGNSGLIWIESANDERVHFLHDPKDETSIASNYVTALYEDREGFIWVGFGAFDKGVDRLDPETGNIQHYSFYSDPSLAVKVMVLDFQEDQKGRVWIATHGNGIFLYDKASDSIGKYDRYITGPDSVSLPHINQFLIDSKGNLWIGGGGGVMVKGNKTVPLSINKLNLEKETLTHFPLELPVSESINIVISMEEDQSGNIWLMTSQSLIRFNPANGEFKQFHHRNNNFPQTLMRAMIIDNDGNLWIAGTEGFTFFDPEQEQMFTYSPDQFLLTINCQGAAWKNEKGELFFGDSNGFHTFSPEQVRSPSNTFKPKVILTEFRLQDSVLKTDSHGFLKTNIWKAKEIELPHDENVFTIRFSSLYFRDPQSTRYQFILENHDKAWRWAGKDPMVTYSKVSPGEYVFRLRAMTSSGFWSEQEASLKIIIHPPWWANWVAYALYGLVLMAFVFFLFRMQLKRRLAQAEAKSFRQLDIAKTRLYTNISHEFRTPITVIIGMARQIGDAPEKWFREGLDMIVRNSQRLLNLVNQMLDLSKLKAGALKANPQQGDMIAFLQYLVEPFQWYAQSKGVQLHFNAGEKELWMVFDPQKLANICSNLLTNAIKFTPKGKQVYLHAKKIDKAGQAYLSLLVKDTGPGIPTKKLPYIFDRFFSSSPGSSTEGEGDLSSFEGAGTGVGLALTKELVKLLDGQIEVESTEGIGSEFTVLLPVSITSLLHSSSEQIIYEKLLGGFMRPELRVEEKRVNSITYGTLPIALIVEDNPDVVVYLQSFLSGKYQVETAQNGAEGIDRAIELIPDIIVSDIMMPVKDGFELCQTLKRDERTCHIPIILLTARADQGSRISGLQLGVDAYLVKPFDKEELLVRMDKLIENRQQLRKYYLATAGLSDEKPEIQELPELPAPDNAFVVNVRDIIEARLDDFDLKVHDICDKVYLSHSQLHRKLKALTGLSTNQFIRQVRLKEARVLLKDCNRSITSVAFDTGFRHPDYFSKVFHDEFGATPSEYRERALPVIEKH